MLFAIAALGFVTLLWFAVRGAEPWVACALSATMIAVGVELTCYYYSFLIVVALLYNKRKEAGAMLLASRLRPASSTGRQRGFCPTPASGAG